MSNSEINYLLHVAPLEPATDAEIATEINKLMQKDIATIDIRSVLQQFDGLYGSSQGVMDQGSLGQASTQDPAGWAADATLQRDLNKFVSGLWSNDRGTLEGNTKQRHATLFYDGVFNFRGFRYDYDHLDDDGNPVTETNRRSLDDVQIAALYALADTDSGNTTSVPGFLYGPPTDPNAATAAEVTQSRVDYNAELTKAANDQINRDAVQGIVDRSNSAASASQAEYASTPYGTENAAAITAAGETAFG